MARFDGLQYAVHKLQPGETVDKKFPELFKKPEFKKLRARPDYNRLTIYIVLLYDKGTDLVDEFRNNLQGRKDAAAIEAGYERSNGKWPEHVQKVMDIRDQDAMMAILAFLKGQRYHIWTEIVVTEQELDEFQRIRFASITTGKKKKAESDTIKAANEKDKLKEACELRIKSLETLYNQFYEDHTELKYVEFSEPITPENAERILESEKPPYEEIK
jgi:hypothetical protein